MKLFCFINTGLPCAMRIAHPCLPPLTKAKETRQYLIWDSEGTEETVDVVTSKLFNAADEEPPKREPRDKKRRGRSKKRSQKDKKKQKQKAKKRKSTSSSSTERSSSTESVPESIDSSEASSKASLG